jgi:hypothetical protein
MYNLLHNCCDIGPHNTKNPNIGPHNTKNPNIGPHNTKNPNRIHIKVFNSK